MKASIINAACPLILSAALLQGCAVSSTLVESKQVTVTHEHRVNLPATMYSPGAGNLPMFEKKGDISLSVSMTNSGKNTYGDSNPEGDPTKVEGGITYDNISKTRTYSVGGGYALTEKIGLIANFSAGKDQTEHQPYIESWDLTQNVYTTDYWVGFPLTWDHWVQGSWQSTSQVQTINDYQKLRKNIVRSYQYFDGEVAIGKYGQRNNLKTGFYTGLGLAQNQFEGHLGRDNNADAYGRHHASFFKLFVLPTAAYSSGWVELGASVKSSFLRYELKSMENDSHRYGAAAKNLFFVEPTVFFRIGPKAFRLHLEHKWLSGIGKSPFPTNSSFTSVGVISMLNVKK